MNVRSTTAAVCAALGMLAAWPASAACSIRTTPIPVTMRGLRPMVAAKINGKDGRFVLDSGTVLNAINGKFAAALKLKPATVAETGTHLNVDAHTDIQGVVGVDTLNGLVKARTFDFAGISFRDVAFMATSQIEDDADGLLGQAFLQRVDVEYDFRSGVVRLAKADGCQGANLAYWAKDGQAYSELPLEWTDPDNPHTGVAVYINGVKLKAMFDTGTGMTFITESAAARAGVKVTDPGVRSLGYSHGLDASFKSWAGAFASVKIGDEEIKNAPMMIGQSRTNQFDVLLGADFFLSHHVYVANGQGKVYFTYEGGAPFYSPSIRQAPAQ